MTTIKEHENKVTLYIDRLNLGNNFTTTHLVEAIKANDEAMECIEALMYVDLSKDLELSAGLKYNHTLTPELWDLGEFLDQFKP